MIYLDQIEGVEVYIFLYSLRICARKLSWKECEMSQELIYKGPVTAIAESASVRGLELSNLLLEQGYVVSASNAAAALTAYSDEIDADPKNLTDMEILVFGLLGYLE